MDKYLPEKFEEKIYTFGEWSYGVNKITIMMDDGAQIRNVKVSGLRILKIGESKKVDIDTSRIIDILDET